MSKFYSALIICTSFLVIPMVNGQDACLNEFNNTLGKTQSEVLDLIVLRIDSLINSAEGGTYADQHRLFMSPIASGEKEWPDSNDDLRKQIQRQIIDSGIDTTIWDISYRKRDEKPEISYAKHPHGNFVSALHKALDCDQDNIIKEYLESIDSAGDIDPSLIAAGATKRFKDENYNHPVIKRILVIELYIHYYLRRFGEN